MKCKEGHYGKNYNLTSSLCDGKCSFIQLSTEDRKDCKLNAILLLFLVASILAACSAVAYLVRRRFKKVRVRVEELKQENAQAQGDLKRAEEKVIELTNLHKPSSEQEAIFQKYRSILKEGNSESMPHKVIMYTMENIKLEKSLGKGGYGEVFKGVVSSEHFGETIQKDVALKQLLISSSRGTETVIISFLSEVRALASLGAHQNVVAFYGVAWDIDSFPSIVLEFVPGGELTTYLHKFSYKEGDSKGLGNETLQSIAIGIAKGLQHIHGIGMVHRDLKPQNVLLGGQDPAKPPVPKIADFGESRNENVDETMTFVGTRYYMSPEIFRGERYGTAADIFSLGIMLNQMDTLQHPGTGVVYDAMQRRMPGSFRPRIREGVPDKILAILKACTRFDDDPAYGAEGDLSYGRPSIEAVLNMLEMLGDGKDLEKAPSTKLNAYARQTSIKKEMKSLSQEFIDIKGSAFEECFRAIPPDSLEAFLKLFHTFINERQQTTIGVTEGRKHTKFTAAKAVEALKLSIKAHSLDEFLSLLRLSHFKGDLVDKMNLGSTLEEVAAKVSDEDCSADFFMQAIPTISRSQANRMAKYLKRNHARRLHVHSKAKESKSHDAAQSSDSSKQEEKKNNEEIVE